ncbi:NADH dehydrogenase [ubiquinone] iron-sulfur protein 4, mitochondrial-like [Malus sylvestris]|uniref:NADH dehydrogenase [ubiquinone] iron-sulfur protein 4, mitochondrial-like n=1 Tax=Malus sylvestris TaxID=3752 RepID=UPI0021AC2B78|nr:NADH dehydrogenase [ubiquinone] iron-sulfur protein 4, mitochondrial-like [Malus sylvestris]
MARPLRHGFNVARAHVLSRPRWASSQSAEALVEVKVSDIGMISGIPEQHLRRRLTAPRAFAIKPHTCHVVKRREYARYESEEAARAFAEKYGWDYTVRKRHTPLLKAKAYADNFKWKGPDKSEKTAADAVNI